MSTLTPNTFASTSFSGGGLAAKTIYSTTAPINTTGFGAGDTWYVTPLGTQADSDNATDQYRFDGLKWVKTPCNCIGQPTDEIACKLSTSLALFNAAPNGQSIQITAAEYANLMTMVGANKFGATDATMATNPPQGFGCMPGQTQSYDTVGVFDGTYFASNQYLIAFSLKSANSSVAANYYGCKIKWGSSSLTSVSEYTVISSNVPALPYTQTYYAVKGSGLSPSSARFSMYQPDNPAANPSQFQLIGSGNDDTTGTRWVGVGDVNTLTSSYVGFSPPYIQGIMAPTRTC